jgi:protein gp37
LKAAALPDKGVSAVADRSAIEWTSATWNPTTGCDRISAGCDHCYALGLSRRLKAMGQPKYQNDGDPRTSGPGFGVTVHPGALHVPLRWRQPRLVFVNSMSDLFHARVDAAFVAQVWAVMAAAPQHTYQVLTKRPERLARVLAAARAGLGPAQWPLPNVWLGTSVESDELVGRADHLRAAPAAVRFLSLEPLLGPLPSLDLTGIDWVIVGGESGPDYRALDLGWVRQIRDQCVRLGVPLFFKLLCTKKALGKTVRGPVARPSLGRVSARAPQVSRSRSASAGSWWPCVCPSPSPSSRPPLPSLGETNPPARRLSRCRLGIGAGGVGYPNGCDVWSRHVVPRTSLKTARRAGLGGCKRGAGRPAPLLSHVVCEPGSRKNDNRDQEHLDRRGEVLVHGLTSNHLLTPGA